MNLIEIDGSFGEGGGQIVRTALSLSCITGKPFTLFNIRKGRKRPGLMPQHITCVNAVAQISNARVSDCEKGSTGFTFIPGKIESGDYIFDIKTAGSISLVFQTILPPLLFSGSASRITIKGGTHVPFSPPYHYISEVFLPTLEKIGIFVKPSISTYGFYPQGGGEAVFSISPAKKVKNLDLFEKGKLQALYGYSGVSRLPLSIAERQKDAALKTLHPLTTDVKTMEVSSPGQGTFIFLKAAYEHSISGFSSLGKRGKPAEQVGQEAAEALLAFHQSPAPLDPHLSDQIVIYLSLSKENSSFVTSKITQHLLTNLWVIEQFLTITYQIEGTINSEGKITIEQKN
jgi:RNA 3'-terminal phosphate cyclase (ATP)